MRASMHRGGLLKSKSKSCLAWCTRIMRVRHARQNVMSYVTKYLLSALCTNPYI